MKNRIIILGLILIIGLSIGAAGAEHEKFDYLKFINETYKRTCSPIEKCGFCVNITLTGEVVCTEMFVKESVAVDVYPILACKGTNCNLEFRVTDPETKTKDYTQHVSFQKAISRIPHTKEEWEVIGYDITKKNFTTYHINGNANTTVEKIISKEPIKQLANTTYYRERATNQILSPDFEYDYKEWAEFEGTGLANDTSKLVSLWHFQDPALPGNLTDAKGTANWFNKTLGTDNIDYNVDTPVDTGMNWTSHDDNGIYFESSFDYRSYTSTNDYTITAFFNHQGPTGDNSVAFWANAAEGADLGVFLGLDTNGAYIAFSGGGQSGFLGPGNGCGTPNTAMWNVVALKLNGTKAFIYQNGTRVCEAGFTSSSAAAATAWIANDDHVSVHSFFGTLDEMAFFSPALTDEEILIISNNYFIGPSDTTPPEINLTEPPNGSTVYYKDRPFVFNATATDTSGIAWCALYHNETGNFVRIQNKTSGIVSGEKFSFDPVNVTRKTIVWNVKCADNSTNQNLGWAENNFTLTIANSVPEISSLKPEDDYHDRINLTVNFTYVDEDNDNGTCDLYINDSLNMSKYDIASDSLVIFNPNTTSDGHYSWYVDCTDNINVTVSEERLFVLDLTNPIITWTYPSEDNTTISNEDLSLDISCEDVNLYQMLVNVTDSLDNEIDSFFYNTTTETTLTVTDTVSLSAEDAYTVKTTCSDQHTAEIIPDYDVDKDVLEKKLTYGTGDNVIDISLKTSDISLDDFSTEKSEDRYVFSYDFSSTEAGTKRTFVFVLEAENPLIYFENSKYKAHFISNKNWIDFNFDDGDAEYNINKVSDYKYEISISTIKTLLDFNSIGGLNIVEEHATYEYEITAPYYTNNATNGSDLTKTGETVQFNVTWYDDYNPSHYIFCFGDGVDCVNETPQSYVSGQKITINKTMGAVHNDVVEWQFYANDTAGNWNNTPLATFTIANTIPTITAPSINNSAPYTNDVLRCDNGSFIDADGESAVWYYRWFDNDVLISGQTSLTLDLSISGLDRNDVIICETIGNDGTDNSTALNSSLPAIIQNFIPTHSTPLLTSSSGTNFTNENLTCYNQSTYDGDGDSVVNIYNWYKNNNPLNNLYLPFEINVDDYSGNGNDGTSYGGIFVNGKIGNALEFNGSEYISVADSNTLDFTDKKTWELWFKRANLGTEQVLFDKSNANTNYKLSIGADNKLQFSYSVPTGFSDFEWLTDTQAEFENGAFNKTLFNSSAVAINTTTIEQQIFFDGFESGSFATNNWILSADTTNWSVSTASPFEGTFHATIIDTGSVGDRSTIEKSISTLGFSNIKLSYAVQRIGLDAPDDFTAEYFNGTNYNALETGGNADDSAYLNRSFSLPSDAANNSNFKIRFSCVGSGTTEGCRIDNVQLNGTVTGFFSSGIYTSEVFNSGKSSEWINFSWQEQLSTNTDIVLQVRSCDDSLCSGEVFIGPDNTSATNFTNPAPNDISFVIDNQYFQFRTFFSTTNYSFSPGLVQTSIIYRQAVTDDSANISSTAIGDTNWHYAAITFDDSVSVNNFNIYIDGTLDTTMTEHRLPSELANNLLIARNYQGTNFFNGTLDEFRIYNYVLTPEQINNNFLLNYNKILSNETTRNENYICSITPNDGIGDGITKNSTPLTIKNYIPSPAPTLLKPDDGFTSGALPEFNWTESFDTVDNDAVYYIIQIDNNSDFSSVDYTNTLSEPKDTNVVLDSTKIDTYWWRVLATDSYDNSSWSEVRTFQYAMWNITFNVTSGELDIGGLVNVNITSCTYAGFTFDGDTTNPYGPYAFPPGEWECSFERNLYFPKTKLFTADKDKIVDVTMSLAGYISYEEHTWLEALYNCIILKDCDLYDLLITINQTASNIWQNVKPTDESVIETETEISRTLNSTSNITYQYKVNIPIKAGYSLGAYLPVRIGFWFMNESNESCYSQGTLPDGVTVIEPYCNPLMVETVGPMGGSVNFRVDLRPNLTAGTYNIKRTIEIDPNDQWEGYGQEIIGQITVTEDMTDSGNIDLDKTGETMPDTSSGDSSSNPPSAGGGGGGGSVTNIYNIYNITNIIEGEEEGEEGKGSTEEEGETGEETTPKSGLAGITGRAITNLPKASPLVGSMIVILIVLGGLGAYLFMTKKE